MIWKPGQYLLFKNNVAKITKVNKDCDRPFIIMRKFSLGYTVEGYSWQHQCRIKHLDRLYEKSLVRILKTEEILRALLKEWHPFMPLKKVGEGELNGKNLYIR